MFNKVYENFKAFCESHKAMKKELSELKEDVENMTEEELQFLDSIKLEEQIRFQESTAVVAS